MGLSKNAAVNGFNASAGYGVFGFGSGAGPGVGGQSANGVGVTAASGGTAQLLLDPSFLGNVDPLNTGRHDLGQIYLDAHGALFECVQGGDFSTANRPVFIRVGLNSITPTRVCDTRPTNQQGSPPPPLNTFTGATHSAATTLTIPLSGPIGPSGNTQTIMPVQASAVVFNVAVTNTAGSGFLTAYPADATSAPNAASLNWVGGQTISNSVTVKLGPISGDAQNRTGIKVLIGISSADVIIDVGGFYS